MRAVNVVAIQRISAADRSRIEAVDPSVRLIDAGGWFDGEYRETWPAYSAARYLSPKSTGQGTREERDKLLAETEVILGGWPFPLDLRARAPRLKWFHQRPAGADDAGRLALDQQRPIGAVLEFSGVAIGDGAVEAFGEVQYAGDGILRHGQRVAGAARRRHHDVAAPQIADQQVAGTGGPLVKPFEPRRPGA